MTILGPWKEDKPNSWVRINTISDDAQVRVRRAGKPSRHYWIASFGPEEDKPILHSTKELACAFIDTKAESIGYTLVGRLGPWVDNTQPVSSRLAGMETWVRRISSTGNTGYIVRKDAMGWSMTENFSLYREPVKSLYDGQKLALRHSEALP